MKCKTVKFWPFMVTLGTSVHYQKTPRKRNVTTIYGRGKNHSHHWRLWLDARHCSKCFMRVKSSILRILRGRYWEEAEAQRGDAAGPLSHSQKAAQPPGLAPGLNSHPRSSARRASVALRAPGLGSERHTQLPQTGGHFSATQEEPNKYSPLHTQAYRLTSARDEI